MKRLVWCVFVLILIGESKTCTDLSNCGKCSFPRFNTDVIAFLDNEKAPYRAFIANFEHALTLLKTLGPLKTQFDKFWPHVTLSYYCCQEFGQYQKIADILKAQQWPPLKMEFEGLVCNRGGDGANTTSLIIKARNETQQELGALVASWEEALARGGITIKRPRRDQEFFHATLCVVEDSFPIEQGLDLVNRNVKNWTNGLPIVVDVATMLFPLHQFHSQQE